jgi:hypothetical protein
MMKIVYMLFFLGVLIASDAAITLLVARTVYENRER